MEPITVDIVVRAPIEKVWEYWTDPYHIPLWSFATDDWGAEALLNELHNGGAFKTRMFAKDGSGEFEFAGTYTKVEKPTELAYVMSDGRTVTVTFTPTDEGVHIIETFDPENENPAELQREGWQAFLVNFKTYVESSN